MSVNVSFPSPSERYDSVANRPFLPLAMPCREYVSFPGIAPKKETRQQKPAFGISAALYDKTTVGSNCHFPFRLGDSLFGTFSP